MLSQDLRSYLSQCPLLPSPTRSHNNLRSSSRRQAQSPCQRGSHPKLHQAPQLLKRQLRTQSCSPIAAAASAKPEMKALIFDCDGVILESENLHRSGYNDSFEHFGIRHEGKDEVVSWSVEFYDMLQNFLGGGKQKMRWYFDNHGWPLSNIEPGVPKTEEEKTALIDTLQEWKTIRFQEYIGSGNVPARPGVNRLFDEAVKAGLKVGVCSAATKSSAVFTLTNLMGKDKFEAMDIFIAGDDVPRKKPDPVIYTIAAERLGVQPENCLVIEDSTIGLKAAVDAGMRCMVTYTHSTADQEFPGAEKVLAELDNSVTVEAMKAYSLSGDDRKK